MTGPEHFRAAETLLTPKSTKGPWADGSGDGHRPPTPDEVARATAHATLALAAATALTIPDDGGYGLVPEWRAGILPRT